MDHAIQNKAPRLLEIRSWLQTLSPRGVTSAELGRHFDLSRSGALKNLRSASDLWPEIYQDDSDKRWYIRPGVGQLLLSLNPEEAGVLHLATRLFSRMMPQLPVDTVKVLEKLSKASVSASPVMSELIGETASELAGKNRAASIEYQGFLKRIHLAMESHRALNILYEKKNGQQTNYSVLPLFLEPYGQGRSLYLCAYEYVRERYLSLKSERILDVRIENIYGLLGDDREGRHNQDIRELRGEMRRRLNCSWGIWGGPESSEEVELLFESSLARRVKESLWHSGQQLIDHPQGLLMRVSVTSPMEMYPWIRSWGPAVEILKPQWLRDRLIEDLEKTLRLYGY
ncbi:MAG: WYL domain-containing protein [Spirochaetaceae bacterium]|jgi:predicted DNA-binding transcriptional regulator YafY|nr:WYL domain-containing protein [Spirochaetaceae bacterium]